MFSRGRAERLLRRNVFGIFWQIFISTHELATGVRKVPHQTAKGADEVSGTSRKAKLVALLLGVLSFATLTGANAHSYGISGQSQSRATCHSASPSQSVSVAISGIPSSYQPGTTYPLTVSV